MGHYDERVQGRSAEQILATAGGGKNTGPVTGSDGEYLRVAAQVRSTQELIEALSNASASNSALSARVFWLTLALIAVGILQVLATAWPNLPMRDNARAAQQRKPGASPTETDRWERTRECAARADQWAASVGLVEGQRNGDVVTLGWTNHYNAKYEQCYLRVSYLHKGGKATPPGDPISYDELWDAYERKLLSTCAGAKFGTGTFCSIDGQKGFDCAACQHFVDERMDRDPGR